MTSFAAIENKISSVRKYLGILERYKKYSREEIDSSIDLRGALERYLYLVIQATIDLAEAVISYKNIRKPSTLSESFVILEEAGIIPSKLMESMVRMTGFRNVVAHDYEELDYDVVLDILHSNLPEIEEFSKKVGNL
ncbi:MAG: DUF86 domain-containing protein [Thermodesulfovibrionales bacterium]